MPRQFVQEIVQSVPRECEAGPAARTALIELIVQRALYLTGCRTGTMGIHLYQRDLNLPTEREEEP